MLKSVSKPLPRLYPQKLETIGDHLKAKRLDLRLGQKDLVETLQACQGTIKNWEKGYREPAAKHIYLITRFLAYCPLLGEPVLHFGHQLRNYRMFTGGINLIDMATEIGIDMGTLSDIEQTNIIRYKSVLDLLNSYLKKIAWSLPDNTDSAFVPKRSSCNKPPKFHTPENPPQTLGEHIAVKRKQLNLTQFQTMERISVVSHSTYRGWEKGTAVPHIKFYPQIMKFLGYCPVQYCQSEGHRLKLMRMHKGFSNRQVDRDLNLSKGCTYRAERSKYPKSDIITKLIEFYQE